MQVWKGYRASPVLSLGGLRTTPRFPPLRRKIKNGRLRMTGVLGTADDVFDQMNLNGFNCI